MYTSTFSFNPSTGVLSGTLSGAPDSATVIASAEPVSDVVVSGYADYTGNAGGYFAQVRSDGAGNWSLPTASLTAGAHVITITADYKTIAGSISITASGPGVPPGWSVRCDLQVNSEPRD